MRGRVGSIHGEEQGAHQDHRRDDEQRSVVAARRPDEVAEQDGTGQASRLAGRVHRPGDGAGVLFAEVETDGPSRREHAVHGAEAERQERRSTAALPGVRAETSMRARRDRQTGRADESTARAQAEAPRQAVAQVAARQVAQRPRGRTARPRRARPPARSARVRSSSKSGTRSDRTSSPRHSTNTSP